MLNSNIFMLVAAINGFLAVTLGAFGSHGLKGKIPDAMLAVWHTAVQYHFYHVIALLLVSLVAQKGLPSPWLNASSWGFTVGLILFCGSLYGIALGGPKWLGPITPLGGLSFMVGWLCLAYHALVKG